MSCNFLPSQCTDCVSLGSDGHLEQEESYACSFSSGRFWKGPLSPKVRERSEDLKRESKMSVKKGPRKPGNRKMKESEPCKK